jgi:hypothetical protein
MKHDIILEFGQTNVIAYSANNNKHVNVYLQYSSNNTNYL